MANNGHLALPEIIELNDYNGDFHKFLDAAYAAFKEDFVYRKPIYRGQRLGLKKYPMYQDKEATFWHMTSDGDDEENRQPDLRRLERIKWPAPLINNSTYPDLKVWENVRGRNSNILIFHEDESYLVVLRKGNGYLLPWTAYIVEHNARRKKLMKEYETYINAKSAQL